MQNKVSLRNIKQNFCFKKTKRFRFQGETTAAKWLVVLEFIQRKPLKKKKSRVRICGTLKFNRNASLNNSRLIIVDAKSYKFLQLSIRWYSIECLEDIKKLNLDLNYATCTSYTHVEMAVRNSAGN